MLTLKNVSKTYVTKSKVETQALKDVNLEIGSRGMVFVLGKSGSGKSTMLNLLGGLDSPTSGEIFVNGASMAKFKQRDYDAYRNEYVGFIFQEFNLLKDFDVRDNVALALRLSKVNDVEAKVSEALKQVELSDEYLNRRIDEMSGGEKQRIAIARALIKDSKIILADEPTGNLDSATGESIWNILKELSRERLVIVVSHDRESAERYGDRIIEIADGKIIADNGTQTKEEADEAQTKPATIRSRLSFATRLKMGFNNLRLRKFKTISALLMTILCTWAILITQMFLSFSSEAALADYITEYNVDYFTVRQGRNDSLRFISSSSSTIMRSGTKKFISDNCRSISDGIIESKQDLLDFGLSFVGEALELDDNSFYATSKAIEDTYVGGYGNLIITGHVEVNGDYVQIDREKHPVEYLIGKKVKLWADSRTAEGVLAGVIDCEPLSDATILRPFFYNEGYADKEHVASVSLNTFNDKTIMRLGDKTFDGEAQLIEFSKDTSWLWLGANHDVIVTANGMWSKNEDITLNDNEIVLPYEMYAKMFNANSKWYYVNSTLDEVRNMPSEIGQTFDLNIFFADKKGELLADCGEVRLVGIYFSTSDLDDFGYKVLLSHNTFRQIHEGFKSPTILVQTSSVKNLRAFATTLRNKHLGYIHYAGLVEVTQHTSSSWDGDIAYFMYGLEEGIGNITVLLFVVCAILIVILVLLVINLISFSVASRKKEIGILSAIGASNGDITSIFLLETSIIALIGFILTLALSFVAPPVFNTQWSEQNHFTIVFPLIRVDMGTVATLIASSFGLLLLATLIPLRKIFKLKPIDAIRNV